MMMIDYNKAVPAKWEECQCHGWTSAGHCKEARWAKSRVNGRYAVHKNDRDPFHRPVAAQTVERSELTAKPAGLESEVALRMQSSTNTARPSAEPNALQKCRKCDVTTDGCAKGHCPVCAARYVAAGLQVRLDRAEASNEALRRRNQQLCKDADLRAREAKLNSAVAKLQSPHSPRKLRVDGGGW